MTQMLTTCPHDCPSVCALKVEKLDQYTIGKVTAVKEQNFTHGVMCAKVAQYKDRVHHPHRLTQPLLRTGDKGVGIGAFQPISWNAALDLLTDKFTSITKTYGSEAIWPYFYAGTMGLIQRDSIHRLTHALDYTRQKSTICVALADAGYTAGTGIKRGANALEVAHSDLIVIWGGNPVHTQINFMHHVTQARAKNNAKLVVIDPYVSATAKKADMHLMLAPGTDGALATGVLHYLFAHDLVNWDYMHQYTDDPEGLAEHVKDKDLTWASQITGLSEQQIATFAELYGNTPKAFLRLCHGFTRSRNGALNMHAASCLPAVTGAWQHLGGGALYGQSAIYELDSSYIKAEHLCNKNTRIIDQCRIGAALTGSSKDLQDGPPIKAMLIQNTNPMVVAPDTHRVREGLARDDLFVCVHEQFMTETAAMADLVLPATMFVEHDDIYMASGHTYLQLGRKIIDGPPQCRSNHWLINQLAKRLGCDDSVFNQTETQLIEDLVTRSGKDWAALQQDNWLDCAPSFAEAHFLNGFAHVDKKFHFRHGWQALAKDFALSPFPDHTAVTDSQQVSCPFRLVTASSKHFLNSSFNESLKSQKLERQPELMLHPDDAKNAGVQQGDTVIIGNQQGQVTLTALITEGIRAGTLVCESLWPNKAFADGNGINSLISADPGFPFGGGVFHDTGVWLRKAYS